MNTPLDPDNTTKLKSVTAGLTEKATSETKININTNI